MQRLAGKVAIVTGASRGIGRVLALTFAREGADVVVAAKSEAETARLPGTIYSVAREVEAFGVRALPIKVDVRQQPDIEAMVAETVQQFGRIDILINNAGALWWQDVADTPMFRFDLMHEINVRASFAASQAVLPAMTAAGGGHIMVCSPPIDLSVLPHKTGYLISKYGMTMLALGLAEEVRERNIAVNALWPVTLIESQATINFNIGGPKLWRKAEIVADAALEVVTSPPMSVTGRALLDEDFLRERGVTDFNKYRCDPEHEPPRLTAADVPKVGRAQG
ncbi:MAG: SDR family oxidoreductase [Myxococcales bacterium]|nr:SDR family oxidoreductase [Myxococcales bacterium]